MIENLLTYIIFTPLLGALVVLFLPQSKTSSFKWVALGALGVTLVLSVLAVTSFDASVEGLTNSESQLQLVANSLSIIL